MFYLPIMLTVIANVLYHVAQKNISEKIHPMLSLIATYIVALVISVFIYWISKKNHSIKTDISYLNWGSILLGVAIVLLELGFLLAYRQGWNISTASIVSTISVTLILIPLGILFFKEQIILKNFIGILLSVVGIIMMNLK